MLLTSGDDQDAEGGPQGWGRPGEGRTADARHFLVRAAYDEVCRPSSTSALVYIPDRFPTSPGPPIPPPEAEFDRRSIEKHHPSMSTKLAFIIW